MRYRHLLEAVRAKQPRSILEIGTWNGNQALAMLQLAPEGCRYYGFDLFEDASVETDREEMNVKPHYYMERVEEKLAPYDVLLTKGNTRETLATFSPPEPIDFVWLDGGHSVETIRSDWENVRRVIAPDAWVFFDDYYSGGIDTSNYGCNSIVAGLKHELLPDKDPVRGGGWVQMVRVWP
jgi:predicted O-methyltransferase YrrM